MSERMNLILQGISVREFAYKVGLSEGTLRTFKNGRVPRADDLLAIARCRGVDPLWLLTGEGDTPELLDDAGVQVVADCLQALQEPNAVYSMPPRLTDIAFLEEYALIDGYHVQVGAGTGQLVADEQVTRRLAFRRKWLRYRNLQPDELVVVFAKGDSMEPTIHNHDSILVDTSHTHIVDGSIFVIRLGDELYAKRLQKLPDGGVHIISDNQSYKMLKVQASEMPTLQVIGKVVWIGHDV